jgi:hypothetical protein
MPASGGLVDVLQVEGLVGDEKVARVRLMDSGDDLDERGLARAVLAQSAWIEPGRSRNDTSESATTPGNVLVTWSAAKASGNRSCSRSRDAGLAPGAHSIDAHGPKDEEAQRDLHRERIDAEEDQRLRDDGNDHDAQHRPLSR